MSGISDRIKGILVCSGLMAVLYLFYRSVFVLTLLLPCIILYRKFHKKEKLIKRKALLRTQFKDMLDSMTASLRAGYSVNNAFNECMKDMKIMHGEDSPIYQEILLIINQINMGSSTADAINDFADRADIADIYIFASVYATASRTGGDMISIIRKTAEDIGAKIDTENEIDVLISAKKLEMNIMSLIPMGIIMYISIASGGLLDPLYGNAAGVIIMTVCLAVYASAFLLGRRMVRIEV